MSRHCCGVKSMKQKLRLLVTILVCSALMTNIAWAGSEAPIEKLREEFLSHKWLTKDDMTSEVLLEEHGLRIQTKGNYAPFFEKLIQPYEIIISEEKSGALKAGKNLYLKVQEVKFCDFIVIDQVNGDLQFDYDVIEDGLLKISVKKGSTVPAKLRIHQIAIDMEGHRYELSEERCEYIYCYPLMIDVTRDMPNNMFASNKDILVCDNFAMQISKWAEVEYYPDCFNRIIVGKDYITKQTTNYPLENHSYMKDGYLMVPLKETIQRMTGLKPTWDQAKKEAIINYWEWGEVHIPVGQKWMIYRDKKTELVKETEIVNGVLYMSFRDMMNLITNYDKYMELYWSEKHQAASYRINLLYNEYENNTNSTEVPDIIEESKLLEEIISYNEAGDERVVNSEDVLNELALYIVRGEILPDSENVYLMYDNYTLTNFKVNKVYKGDGILLGDVIQIKEPYYTQTFNDGDEVIYRRNNYTNSIVGEEYIFFFRKDKDGSYWPSCTSLSRYALNDQILVTFPESKNPNYTVENYQSLRNEVLKKYN